MAGHHHLTATVTADATTTATYDAIVEVIRRFQTVGYCLDLDTSVQRTSAHISPLFHHLLSLFVVEIIPSELRPPPHTPHDGRPVDLFKLFCCVRDRGGYDVVTATETWAPVGKETGFGTCAASAVKLLYSKHLFPMERWLGMVLSKKARRYKVVEEKREECETPRELKTKVLWTVPKMWQQTLPELENGDGLKSGLGVVVEEGPYVGCNTGNTERAQLSQMVNWVRRVARRPGHPSFAVVVQGKSESVGKDVKLFKLALLAREAVFTSCSRNGGSLQQCPSIALGLGTEYQEALGFGL